MEKTAPIDDFKEKIELLELKIKHLKNDLFLTRKENECAIANYFELYSDVEKKVAERTKDVVRLKKKLEQKAKELEIMLDASPGIIFFKDHEQRILRVNRKFLKIVGLPVHEVIGRKYTEFFTEDKDIYLNADNEVINEGRALLNRKEFIQTPEGKRIISIDRIPYKDMDEHVAGLIGFAIDITDMERVEEEKKRLESQLQYAQRMESIGTLAGGMAHNFNNLLMGILGNSTLMMIDTDPESPHYQYLKTIETLVKNGSDLTRQLLDYAKEGDVMVKVWNLNHLVSETSKTFGITRKEITVHLDLEDRLPGVKVDKDQIEQVLLNLFINAADAIKESGDLFLKTECVTHMDIIGKSYDPKPGVYVLLTVKDTGSGMDQATMERIFDPFYTTKGLARGTGLGLASVYGTIKAHSGYIDVSSEKGKGTTFYIYLPATLEELTKIPESQTPKLIKGTGTVLLVDDEEVVVEAGEHILKKLGYFVIAAENGKKALELFKQHHDKIDIVLLDMIMPEMSGGEVFNRLREIDPEVKVLLSSGYSLDGHAQEIIDRGCNGFIQKPFTIAELSQKIAETLWLPV